MAATADSPAGPYKRQRVAVSAQAHNPQYVYDPHTKQHLIFHIGDGRPHGQPRRCTNGTSPPSATIAGTSYTGCPGAVSPCGSYVSFSSSLSGAFTTIEVPFNIENKTSAGSGFVMDNPAPYVFPNGSVLVLFRKINFGHQAGASSVPPHTAGVRGTDKSCTAATTAITQIWLATAPSFRGPYTVRGHEPITQSTREEDPAIWRTARGLHVVFHGPGHAFSTDGLVWTFDGSYLPDTAPSKCWAAGDASGCGGPFIATLRHGDGSVEVLRDAERPRVWVNTSSGQPELLFFSACYNDSSGRGCVEPTAQDGRTRGITVVQRIRKQIKIDDTAQAGGPRDAVSAMKTDEDLARCGPKAPPCPHVRVNPLKGLPQLTKVHYSWSLPYSYQVPYWENLTVSDGLLVDYARVTGSLSIQINSADWDQNSTTVLVQACDAATRMSSPPREVKIGVNYSPWQHIYKSKSDPRDESKEAAERARLFTNAPRFLGYVAEANRVLKTKVKIGLVMLDSETFTWNESSPHSWVDALTRKHEQAYNWTQELFPGVRLMYFGYGMSYWRPSTAPADETACFSLAQPPKRGFCTSAAFSYKESFGADVPFAVSLYEPGEPQLERDQFNTTVSAAWARGVQSVVPYIALGCGWVSPGFVFNRVGTMTHHGSFANFLDYDQRYSAQLGRQVNRPEYASSDFGEWQAAEMAIFYPSPLDVHGKASAITNGSTHYMDHLLAFVHGATAAVLKTDDEQPQIDIPINNFNISQPATVPDWKLHLLATA